MSRWPFIQKLHELKKQTKTKHKKIIVSVFDYMFVALLRRFVFVAEKLVNKPKPSNDGKTKYSLHL